jgi:hypothetical protein
MAPQPWSESKHSLLQAADSKGPKLNPGIQIESHSFGKSIAKQHPSKRSLNPFFQRLTRLQRP